MQTVISMRLKQFLPATLMISCIHCWTVLECYGCEAKFKNSHAILKVWTTVKLEQLQIKNQYSPHNQSAQSTTKSERKKKQIGSICFDCNLPQKMSSISAIFRIPSDSRSAISRIACSALLFMTVYRQPFEISENQFTWCHRKRIWTTRQK